MKTIDTIPQDIDKLFHEGVDIDDNLMKSFLSELEKLLRLRLAKKTEQTPPTIRMSKLGTPNRKLWYEFNSNIKDTSMATNALKFVYGDIVEQLVIFLVKQAGHLVEEEQQECVIDGVVGHKDCKIDGYTVDVKSTSSFAFRKFAKAELFQDDPFGYIAQLSSYMYADKNENGAFIAVNKENGQIAILKLNSIDTINPPLRIKEVREVLKLSSPPSEKCYQPVNYSKSSNMVLNKNCNYCIFKDACWSDANNGKGLRKFKYASGIVNFTEVIDTPRVEEVLTSEIANEDDTPF